jgi:hypothetical protein
MRIEAMAMKDRILTRIGGLFDVPVMQNNLRGLWVEAMVAELLGPEWKHTGADWAAWDFERADGLRLEVKQSARVQSWGVANSAPRFSIRAASGHYPENAPYLPNVSGDRLAHVYVFAWHNGDDQRIAEEWQFFVINSDRLRKGQRGISLGAISKLVDPVKCGDLSAAIERSERDLGPWQ